MTYSKFVHRWHRGIGTGLKVFFGFWMVILLGIVGSAAVDLTFGLGWGYQARDLIVGALLIPAGCTIFFVIWLVYRLLGRLNVVLFDETD